MSRTEVRGGQILDASVSLTLDVTGTLPAANGGTGNATNTLNNVLLGNGTGALQAVAPDSSGNILRSNGTTWQGVALIRVTSTTSSATPTPNVDTTDQYILTAQAVAAAFAAPTGTPVDGQPLIIRIKDNATAQTLSWNAIYRIIGTTLPTTTVISKTLYLGFKYNSADTKWDCLAVGQEA